MDANVALVVGVEFVVVAVRYAAVGGVAVVVGRSVVVVVVVGGL